MLINDALDILYRVPLSDASKLTIKQQILLSNQTQDFTGPMHGMLIWRIQMMRLLIIL
ncbi:MAG: hypothetical protein IPP79_23130 [Chitinophagaceae bacterium]|nr:hypothetical protein [Chitinophagaceae bacterium]